jgi:hypothetical protein
MKIQITLLIVLFSLSACFDEGEIIFDKERIDVKVTADSTGAARIFTDFFLQQEINADNNPMLGKNRPVVFDNRYIVPGACTEEKTCDQAELSSFNAIERPHLNKYGIYSGEENAAELIVVLYSKNGRFHPLYYKPTGEYDLPGRIAWMQHIFQRIDINVVTIIERTLPQDASRDYKWDVIAMNAHWAWHAIGLEAMNYVVMTLEGNRPDCPIEEWYNGFEAYHYCDGSTEEHYDRDGIVPG